jgi:hypothetical protein
MLDENGTAILIDFDGSDVVGGTPKKTGTLGWHSLRRRGSFNNDYYSLAPREIRRRGPANRESIGGRNS